MIFYDTTEKRRYLIWAASGMVVILAVLAPLHFLNQLDSSHTHEESFTYKSINLITNPKEIVLTFDDGPDPQYTQVILDILDEYNISAAFFYTGTNIQKYPDLVKEVYARGHIIGNHSYSHSKNVHSSTQRLRREINSTNKALSQVIGHESILYRPPFLLDLGHTDDEVISKYHLMHLGHPFSWLNESGYILVGAGIDSKDWEDITESEMTKNIHRSVRDGQIVLFHDSGGKDRSKTISILPSIIEEMQSQGYKFVSLEDHLGIPKEELMPPAVFTSFLEKTEYLILSFITRHTNSALTSLFFILLILSTARLIFILTALTLSKKRHPDRKWADGVSVLIPAWNEENNIAGTIQSILLSTHKKLEIIVVDDGSTDNTAVIVENLIRNTETNIKLITVKNNGKASALNVAIEQSSYAVLFAIDGDTVIHKEAIEKLAAHFNDKSVGAVAGRIEAITTKNPIAIFQRLEYITSQRIEKIAFDYVGAINIVPGAIGAWRRIDVLRAGGYKTETLVEDQDLTLALLKNGKRVIYEPDGIAYTEVPKNTKSFFKQRYRWIYGTFQCVWKYRSSLFSKNIPLGWIILPYNLIFLAIIPFLLPIMFGVFLNSLISGEGQIIVYSFFIYLIVDILYGIFGVYGQKDFWSLIISIPFQRIYYKIIISIIMILSIIKILEGRRAFWNKLERSGSAQKFFEDSVNKATDVRSPNFN